MSSNEKENLLPVAVILTAIPVEYKAVEAYLNDIKEDKAEDGTIYGMGLFCSDDQEWTVVVRDIGEGNTRAANEVNKAFNRYHPEVMLFCGIAGGIKDVRIGDVVVATKVYSCESGKGETDFRPRPELSQPTYVALEQAKAEAKKSGWLTRLWYKVCSVPKEPPPYHKVHIKPIASVAQVVASSDADMIKRIKEHYNDAIAVEMEGFGFLQSCHQHPEMNSLLVRGISDLLDDKAETDKRGSQKIAATSAAAFTFQVLSNLDLQVKRKKEHLAEVRAPVKSDEITIDEETRISDGSKSTGKIPELDVVKHFTDELKDKGVGKIGVEERVRLFVLAGSLLPYSVKYHELGNHVLHRIYLNRDNENLTSNEQYLIYTTLLRDSWNRKVGWFWLRNIPSKKIVERLEYESISPNGDDKSREGAIKILQILGPAKAEKSLAKIVTECEHVQKRNILDFLYVHGSIESLSAVDKLTVGEHEGVTSKAIHAKIGILSRHKPDQAVKIMIEESKKDPKILIEVSLEKVVDKMSIRSLRKLASSNFLCALKELAKRDKATETELKMMLSADVPEIQYLGYSGLLKHGSKFNPNQIQDNWPKTRSMRRWGIFGAVYEIHGMDWLVKTLLEVYLKLPFNELEGSLELKRQKAIIYLAWGFKGGHSVVEVIRNDLRNNFKRHKKNLLLQIEEANGDDEETKRSRESLQRIEKSITQELTASALKVLEKYGKSRDKMIAKEFLKNDETQIRASAVNLFTKYAGKKDIDVLFDIVNGGDTENRKIAAKRILKLNTGKQHIRDLLKSDYSDVVKEVLCWHITKRQQLNWTDLSYLFYSKNDEIRLLATAYVAEIWTRQKLHSLLKKYIRSAYYYDVVCWLDRVLYAPRNLAKGYKSILRNKLA